MENDLLYFFPEGFRIMVVDEDPESLKLINSTLSNSNIKVTACGRPKAAVLALLQDYTEIDLLLMDVLIPKRITDCNLKVLDLFCTDVGIPLGLMSVDRRDEAVIRGIIIGASFFLKKPLQRHTGEKLWRFAALMKSYSQDRTVGATKKLALSQGDDNDDDGHSNNSGSSKRQRVSWTPDLQGIFLNAFNTLGPRAVPSEIAKLMNVKGVGRQQVASHLQKFRIRMNQQERIKDANSLDHHVSIQPHSTVHIEPLPDLENLRDLIDNIFNAPSEPFEAAPDTATAVQANQDPSLNDLCDNISALHIEDMAPAGGVSQPQFEKNIMNYFDGPIDTGCGTGGTSNRPPENNFWHENNEANYGLTSFDTGFSNGGTSSIYLEHRSGQDNHVPNYGSTSFDTGFSIGGNSSIHPEYNFGQDSYAANYGSTSLDTGLISIGGTSSIQPEYNFGQDGYAANYDSTSLDTGMISIGGNSSIQPEYNFGQDSYAANYGSTFLDTGLISIDGNSSIHAEYNFGQDSYAINYGSTSLDTGFRTVGTSKKHHECNLGQDNYATNYSSTSFGISTGGTSNIQPKFYNFGKDNNYNYEAQAGCNQYNQSSYACLQQYSTSEVESSLKKTENRNGNVDDFLWNFVARDVQLIQRTDETPPPDKQ